MYSHRRTIVMLPARMVEVVSKGGTEEEEAENAETNWI
jgi:hypothetical protein